jgi:hypothetical protein
VVIVALHSDGPGSVPGQATNSEHRHMGYLNMYFIWTRLASLTTRAVSIKRFFGFNLLNLVKARPFYYCQKFIALKWSSLHNLVAIFTPRYISTVGSYKDLAEVGFIIIIYCVLHFFHSLLFARYLVEYYTSCCVTVRYGILSKLVNSWRVWTGNPCWTGRIGTFDLLVLPVQASWFL